MDKIFLEKLKLTNFRNHKNLELNLDHRHVVLTGANGAGKTNILEAVSYLSPGRGLRRAKHDSVGAHGTNGSWAVFAHLHGSCGQVDVGTGIQESAHGLDNQRKVHINGAASRTSDILLENCRVLWLTPAMDGLFTGPAAERRRFLDRMVLAIDPAHGRRVAGFDKAMRNRNRLLAEGEADGRWLNSTEVQLAELAISVAGARHEFASLLSQVIIKNQLKDSLFPDALVSISGYLENEIGETPAADLESRYVDRLRDNRPLDAAAGRLLEGPHRSDLQVTHRPKSMPAAQCSTGEQKALLVGLLLAQARLVSDMSGFPPILLLDEIGAHFDADRRTALYDMIEDLGCQAWMTGTEPSLFTALHNRAQYFSVADGTVIAS